MGDILDLFAANDTLDLGAVATFLDGLDHEGRVRETRKLKKREQSRLFEAAKGFHPITLEHFVPASVPPLTEVIHEGRNTLPAFNFFQKRFCRPEGKADELWGYNEGSTRKMVGPGYFKTRLSSPGEVVIDYFQLPEGKPAAWPEIKPNSSGLSRFVYYEMRDFMRGVTSRVSIGRAARGTAEKPMDAWFILVRA